jgi:hypothetical protein
MVKYPRTPHLAGSRLQPGDEDLAQVPFAAVRGVGLAADYHARVEMVALEAPRT